MKTYEVGDVIDEQFEVLAFLGEGGFGTVLRVHNRADGREYALKFLNTDADLESVQREYAPLRRLNHPNIVRAYWAARSGDGRWYIATEVVDGENLRSLLARDPEPEMAMTLGAELLAALRALHGDDRRRLELEAIGELSPELQEMRETAIVHRDIKPENLIVRPDGHLVLVDFGVASRQGSSVETRTYTPGYTPPDFPSYGPHRWNPDFDRYAAGVVIFELLCGCRPNEVDDPRSEILDSRDMGRSIDDETSAFLRRACAPLEADRFQTTSEMFESWALLQRPTARTLVIPSEFAPNQCSEFVPWTVREIPPAGQLTEQELTALITEIVESEGPILCRRLYDIIEMAGGERPTSVLNVATHRAVKSGKLEQVELIGGGQQNKTIYAAGTEPFVVRTLGSRTPSELPNCELDAWREWIVNLLPELADDAEGLADRIAWFAGGDQADDVMARLRYRVERYLTDAT